MLEIFQSVEELLKQSGCTRPQLVRGRQGKFIRLGDVIYVSGLVNSEDGSLPTHSVLAAEADILDSINHEKKFESPNCDGGYVHVSAVGDEHEDELLVTWDGQARTVGLPAVWNSQGAREKTQQVVGAYAGERFECSGILYQVEHRVLAP